ncbi:MAG TPA: sulfatase-like hydrolase/transferase [Planctomycetota bacterium]
MAPSRRRAFARARIAAALAVAVAIGLLDGTLAAQQASIGYRGRSGQRDGGTGRDRPNVLLLTVDQLSWSVLAYSGAAYPRVQTPNLDRLCAKGSLFRRHYADAEDCHASRSSLLTGKPPHCHGALGNGWRLADTEVTLAESLRAAGYATCAIGKVHTPAEGADQGFESFFDTDWFLEVLAGAGWCPENSIRWIDFRHQVGTLLMPPEWERDRLKTALATDFFRQPHRRPWFLYLSYVFPHPPWAPTDENWAGVRPDDVVPTLPQAAVWARKPPFAQARLLELGLDDQTIAEARLQRMAYVAMVEGVDREIGIVLDELERSGLDERTVIVFTSDHGDMAGQLGAAHKLFGPYESVAHVPLVIVDPAHFPPGSQIDALTQGIDVPATLYELLDLEVPAGLSGRSLLRLPRGGPPVRQFAFTVQEVPPSSWLVTDGRLALILHSSGDPELYDLAADPEQTWSLHADPAYAGLFAELRAVLLDWRLNACR